MLQVVFGDSEKGGLVQAMRFKSEGYAFGVGLMHSDNVVMTEQEKARAQAEAERQMAIELARGKPLGGSPEDAIALPFAPLDIGDIRGPVLSDARKELLGQIFAANRWGEEPDADDSLETYWDSCVNDQQRLLRCAAAGEPVRIWYSGAPYALCGFYSVLQMLQDMDCPVTAVKLPEFWQWSDDSAVSFRSFGEVSAGDWAAFLPLETKIPEVMRSHYASLWRELQQENAPLRAVINGRLYSVDEEFYDRFLLRVATAEPQSVGSVIGCALGRYELCIGDWFLAGRVRKLIDSGVFRMEKQGDGFYGCLIARV